MIKNKKGADPIFGMIIKIILIIGAFFMIMFITNMIISKFLSNPDEQACATKIRLYATLRDKSTDYMPTPWPSNCVTQRVDVKSKIKINAQREIADMMDSCWFMMGGGKISPMSNKLFNADNGCFECFNFRLTKLKDTINKDDFNLYLTQLKKNSNLSYAQYFKAEGTTYDAPYALTDMELEKSYSIVYLDKDKADFLSANGFRFGEVADVLFIQETNKLEGQCLG